MLLVVRVREQVVRAVSHGLSPLNIEQKTAVVWEPENALDEGAREFVPALRCTERHREQCDVSCTNNVIQISLKSRPRERGVWEGSLDHHNDQPQATENRDAERDCRVREGW